MNLGLVYSNIKFNVDFLFVLVGLAVWAFRKNLSLIPLLGLICCLYMMAELSVWNWIYFTIGC
jgi:hypothetical protein